jgi:hypothetical protein
VQITYNSKDRAIRRYLVRRRPFINNHIALFHQRYCLGVVDAPWIFFAGNEIDIGRNEALSERMVGLALRREIAYSPFPAGFLDGSFRRFRSVFDFDDIL